MNTAKPTSVRLLIIIVFIASCCGLLVFLWKSFGGSLPLESKGYRINAVFPQATRLAKEADVRIAGVPVGKVKQISEDVRSGKARVELEINDRYAPIYSNTKAILRQKTLLGETYVELTPNRSKSAPIATGGELEAARISPTVELDEIFRALDPETQSALQTWIQNHATAVAGRGKSINNSIANFSRLADESGPLLDTFKRQDKALKQLVKNTGEIFDALNKRDDQLQGLITNSNRTFRALGRRDAALQKAIAEMPRFQDESKKTFDRVGKFAQTANPLVSQLRPAARELSPVLSELGASAKDFKELMTGLRSLMKASKKGLPAASRLIDGIRPLLAQLDPSLRQVIPTLNFLGLYKRELTAFFANTVAATSAFDIDRKGKRRHYLRTANPLNPENLAAYPERIGSNRSNPYSLPGALTKLPNGLDIFDDRNCNRESPQVSDPYGVLGQDLFERVKRFAFVTGPDGKVAAPECKKQPMQKGQPKAGKASQYPQVHALPVTSADQNR